jgi:hypothetical protein
MRMVADAKNNEHRIARAPRCEAPRAIPSRSGSEGRRVPYPALPIFVRKGLEQSGAGAKNNEHRIAQRASR